jgi:prophage tail gpP-like protein
MRPEVTLLVNGKSYGGWKKISIDRGIETASNAFDLTVTERWSGQDAARPIRPGAACRVAIEGEVVITGYVDDVEISHSASDHTVTVRGRDATGDLVDCSAVHLTGAWRGATLTQIASDLVRPFGISVVAAVDVGAPFPDWQIQEGETVFECIERAARMRGVLVTTDGSGGLVFTRAGTAHAGVALKLGENLLGASGTFSMRERHSEYRVKGALTGSDLTTPEQHSAPAAAVTDGGVPRYRPLILIGEDNGDPAVFGARAMWERNVRYGRAVRIEATVAGWLPAGQLWAPNTLVRYTDAFMGLDDDLLIVGVKFTVDDGGVLAGLSLTRREALDVEPLPADKAKSGATDDQLDGKLAWAWQ